MIRNRQSAAASRKRKADRIDSLVQRVSELEAENRSLYAQIEDLQNKNNTTNTDLPVQKPSRIRAISDCEPSSSVINTCDSKMRSDLNF
mmetsp:Transcript_3708/g.4670  ORF Transcript_3708/g.4670 Transcript_3708/m.4670 type:complete len:89 (-) Transcript_3708:260-526(-)